MRVDIASLPIPGGLLYVGSPLVADSGDRVEPALIDPSLPVDHRAAERSVPALDYWPSYSTISPAARSHYLRWLSGGRAEPSVPIGYVFLYFYGLERRLIVDSRTNPSVAMERDLIVTEIRRLLRGYLILPCPV